MRKIFLFFIATLFSVSMWAAPQEGTLTSSPSPIDPTQTATLTYDGTGTNFANWTPDCFINASLIALDGQSFSKSYSTAWVYCDGNLDNVAANRKMEYAGVAGKYTIDINIDDFFSVEDEDLAKIGMLKVSICTQYCKNGESSDEQNFTKDFYLEVGGEVTLYFVNVPGWTSLKAHVWNSKQSYIAWEADEAMTNTEEIVKGYGIYSYTFPACYNKIIFRGAGDNQTADLVWSASTPYFYPTDLDLDDKYYSEWFESKEAIAPAKFYITGDSALVVDAGLDKSVAWNSHAIKATEDSHVLSLKAGDYQMQVVTTGGDWKDYDNLSDATKANLGITPSNDGNICFTLTAAGNVTITYTNETFTVTGANIKPAEMKTLKIVKTRWDVTDVAAKYAVWMCDDKIRDSFTDFGVAGTNDTITVSYHSKASYCIIVRFPGDLETPSWGESDANVWNKTGLVDLEGDVYTAVSLGGNKSMTGTWDAYYPTIKLYGDFAEVGGNWAETALTGDNESVSVSLSLSGSTTYSFKLKINDVQYSKINATPYELKDNWREVGHFDLDDQGGLNVIKLITDKTGLYTFTYTYATDMLNVVFPTATAIDNTDAATKAVKRIVNGQLVIEREGKLYNALGAEVK